MVSGIGERHADRRMIESLAEALLGSPQRLRGAPLGGHVLDRAAQCHLAAGVVTHRRGDHDEASLGAAGTGGADVHRLGEPLRVAAQQPFDSPAVGRVHASEQRLRRAQRRVEGEHLAHVPGHVQLAR